MPTGYTESIADGISLRQFILSCARAMSACIMQRDDPMGDLPKKREPTDYHVKRIAEAETLLAKIKVMPDDEATENAALEYVREIEYLRSNILNKNTLKHNYEDMLVQVHLWVPPTPDHHGLKKFMISQISESIKFDCSGQYDLKKIDEIKRLTGQEWKDKEIERAIFDLNYHQCEHNKEVELCRKQNEWITQLYNSIPE